MKISSLAGASALAVFLAAGSAQPAFAQFNQSSAVSSPDVQRLQDTIDQAAGEISRLRSRDSALASQLLSELDDLRDEAVYLKVKLRKNEPIARRDVSDLRDRIDDLRSRARGDASHPAPARSSESDVIHDRPNPAGRTQNRDEIPVGTEFDVRLQNALNSRTAQVEDRFEATTMVDLIEGDRLLVPAGSVVRGMVTSVTRAGRLERKGSLTVVFDQLTIRGRSYPIRATVTQALESEGIRGETGRIGAGAGVGAIIGGILGGVKGALAGVLIGGGGVVAATDGEDVDLAAGSVLRVRLDSPLTVALR